MDLTTFLQFFINGIVLGAIYVLLAVGLSIIFGMIGIVNLTHGILYMLGAYATVTVTPYIGFFPSLVLSPLLVALFGMASMIVWSATIFRHGIDSDRLRPYTKHAEWYFFPLVFAAAIFVIVYR